jgi:thiol-disulfide isomerase/thioredoxin
MRTTLAIPSALLALLATARAQDLKLGDPAPALAIAKWIKGEPVAKFAADKVYVVEFWATWCGPCIAGMPHLSKLQADYQDQGLTIIGVSTQDPRNSLAQVEAMVKDKGDGMGYTVAWDDARKTNEAYMRAAKRNSIPCCFLLDKAGKIAFIGHPMWLDLPLAGVMAGTWDPVKGAEELAAADKSWRDVMQRLSTAPDKADADAEALLAKYPFLTESIEQAEYDGWFKAKNYAKAYHVGDKLVAAAIANRNDGVLNHVAWSIVDPDAMVETRDLDLALRAAEKGVEITKGKEPNVLDTLARVHFCKGDVKKALELQKQAVALDGREELQKSLREYEAAAAKGADKVEAAGPKK